MKKIFLSQSLAKAVSVLYLIAMVVLTCKMFGEYVASECSFGYTDLHVMYMAIAASFGIMFLWNWAVRISEPVYASLILSMTGTMVSCIYGGFGIWAELGFFVGAILLFLWTVAIGEDA